MREGMPIVRCRDNVYTCPLLDGNLHRLGGRATVEAHRAGRPGRTGNRDLRPICRQYACQHTREDARRPLSNARHRFFSFRGRTESIQCRPCIQSILSHFSFCQVWARRGTSEQVRRTDVSTGPAREVPAPPPARDVRTCLAHDFTSERPYMSRPRHRMMRFHCVIISSEGCIVSCLKPVARRVRQSRPSSRRDAFGRDELRPSPGLSRQPLKKHQTSGHPLSRCFDEPSFP